MPPPKCRPVFSLGRGLALALAISWALPASAEAKGTFFLLEIDTGIGEPAYASAPPGLNYGVSFGVSWKLKTFPVRWYLLGTATGRNGAASGLHEGVPFTANRTDFDLYIAERSVLPVWRFVRLYVEAGIGRRHHTQAVRRGRELGSLTSSSSALLLVFAAGVQARLSKTFSLGLRGEVTPLDSGVDLTAFAAGLAPTRNRTALLGQIGVHF